MISIVTPAFNEAASLEQLHQRLREEMAALGLEWEWIVVDDHSRDATFEVLRRLAAHDPRVRGIRLARNAGSHAAITCGLHHASGEAAIMLAGDMQDPPEKMAEMVARWRAGAQVVWAVRRQRPGARAHAGFAATYYWVMRHVVGMKEMPTHGADFFLLDGAVLEAFRRFPERNVSVLALLTWLGFRQESIEYDKRPRTAGRSGWTLARKIKLVVDSVVSFSDLPIRLCSYGGIVLIGAALVVFVLGMVGAYAASSLAVIGLTLLIGLSGLQLLALGVVGEYVWRAFDEARRRPGYVIETTTSTIAPVALNSH